MLFDFAILLYILCFVSVGLYSFFEDERLAYLSKFFAISGILVNGFYFVSIWFFYSKTIHLTLSQIFALIIFFLALTAVYLNLKHKKVTIYFFIMPIIILLGIASLYHQDIMTTREYRTGFWLFVHLPFTIAGSSLFMVSAIFGILYFIQEKQIKRKRFGFTYKLLPSIDLLNKINRTTMLVGFTIFTAGILSGFIWGIYEWGGRIILTPKLIFAIISWLIFGVIIIIKKIKGITPRGTAFASILGIISIIVTYIGLAMFIKG
ncbi:MAG: cytochrome c biogenesis protein [Calditerrivibrio sp.]|nr:cytochrome c biogenesis protein [Calditerrivibrio sp.]MCA1931974.1 cytochrome c biogenesis protein [Calditerrivibrio sp.]